MRRRVLSFHALWQLHVASPSQMNTRYFAHTVLFLAFAVFRTINSDYAAKPCSAFVFHNKTYHFLCEVWNRYFNAAQTGTADILPFYLLNFPTIQLFPVCLYQKYKRVLPVNQSGLTSKILSPSGRKFKFLWVVTFRSLNHLSIYLFIYFSLWRLGDRASW